MFCKSGEDLQLCPSGDSMGGTGGIVRTGFIVFMAFAILCDPGECFVCILAIRSSVFSGSVFSAPILATVGDQGVQKEKALA